MHHKTITIDLNRIIPGSGMNDVLAMICGKHFSSKKILVIENGIFFDPPTRNINISSTLGRVLFKDRQFSQDVLEDLDTL